MDIRSVKGLSSLHADTRGDSRVCVAVLDGPVDLSHPCFQGADLTKLDTLVQHPVGGGPMSLHGTHVASVIFGQPGSPVVGIAPHCRGLIVPVFRDDQERRLSQLDLARAIEQAVQEGANIISVSGGEPTPTGEAEGLLERALRLCEEYNVLVVAATGNDGCACLHVPAAVPSVLAVGAIGVDGEPLEISNWGEAYRSNGVLAPGEDIEGAAPGGGTASLTGSSFATPVASGVAALLLSSRIKRGKPLDPTAVRRTIIDTAIPCQPRASPACGRHLAGTLNISGAHTSIQEGAETTVTNRDTAEAPVPATEVGAAHADTNTEQLAGATSVGAHGVRAAAAGGEPSAESPVSRTETHAPLPTVATTAEPAEPRTQIASTAVDAVTGVRPSSADCGCSNGKKEYIFAIGNVGFDFGTEARRDSFRQLMPTVQVGEAPVAEIPPNPYDVIQLCDYLDNEPSESTQLIWTLERDRTTLYALEAKTSYADDVYSKLRTALRNHALPKGDEEYISLVSIPGCVTGKTRKLYSGQTVTVVEVQSRGLYGWEEGRLVDSVLDSVQLDRTDATRDDIGFTVRNFLDKIYYELRNLGRSSPDRALNYAATNAFQLTSELAEGMLSAQMMPGDRNNFYTLDTIAVAKSPYCRMDSDCWDVKVTWFDPENDRRARQVFQYSIDVSDPIPISLAPVHKFFIAS